MINPDKSIEIAKYLVANINAAREDTAIAQKLCDLLNGLSHKETGALALVLATMLSEEWYKTEDGGTGPVN